MTEPTNAELADLLEAEADKNHEFWYGLPTEALVRFTATRLRSVDAWQDRYNRKAEEAERLADEIVALYALRCEACGGVTKPR